MNQGKADIKTILAALIKKEAEKLKQEQLNQEDYWADKYGRLAIVLPLIRDAALASPPELVTYQHNELMGSIRLTLDDLRWYKNDYTIEPTTGFSGGDEGYSIRKVATSRSGSFHEDWSAFETAENAVEYCLVEIAKFVAKAQRGMESCRACRKSWISLDSGEFPFATCITGMQE